MRILRTSLIFCVFMYRNVITWIYKKCYVIMIPSNERSTLSCGMLKSIRD